MFFLWLCRISVTGYMTKIVYSYTGFLQIDFIYKKIYLFFRISHTYLLLHEFAIYLFYSKLLLTRLIKLAINTPRIFTS